MPTGMTVQENTVQQNHTYTGSETSLKNIVKTLFPPSPLINSPPPPPLSTSTTQSFLVHLGWSGTGTGFY